MSTPPEWHRLANLLVSRRIELGYRQRKEFAKAHGLRYDRLLFDLENAKRTNYESGTIAHFEQLYKWAPGSIQTVLEGGEPVPSDRPQTVSRAKPIEEFSNEELLLELSRRIAVTDRRVEDVLRQDVHSPRRERPSGGAGESSVEGDGGTAPGFVPRTQPEVG